MKADTVTNDLNFGKGWIKTGLYSKEANDAFMFVIAIECITDLAYRHGSINGMLDISPWVKLSSGNDVPKVKDFEASKRILLQSTGFDMAGKIQKHPGEIWLYYLRMFPLGEPTEEDIIDCIKSALQFLNEVSPNEDEVTVFTEGPRPFTLSAWYCDNDDGWTCRRDTLFKLGRKRKHTVKKSTLQKLIDYFRTKQIEDSLKGEVWDAFKEIRMNEVVKEVKLIRRESNLQKMTMEISEKYDTQHIVNFICNTEDYILKIFNEAFGA